jgi:hypothetical protein
MAKQLQLRKGTAIEHDTFTGADGEVTVDTTNNTLRVHDGSTVGGIRLATLAGGLVPTTQLPAATISTQGVVALDNTLNSVSTAQALTAQQGWVLKNRDFGFDQSWQDVTAYRAQSTNYINNTGKTIFVNIYSTIDGNSSAEVTLTVGGLVVGQNITRFGQFVKIAFVCAPVPHGQTYSMSWAGTASIKELR